MNLFTSGMTPFLVLAFFEALLGGDSKCVLTTRYERNTRLLTGSLQTYAFFEHESDGQVPFDIGDM